MRIGFDATPLLGARTGVGWYTAELIEAVAAAAPDDQLVLFPITWRSAGGLNPPQASNIQVVRRFAPSRPLRTLWERVPVPGLEWFVSCDVFHGTNYLAPPARRTPVVISIHDLGFVHHPELCRPADRRYADLLPTVARRASAILAISEFTRDELTSWLPDIADKVHVVYLAPRQRPATQADCPVPAGDPFVLFIGELGPRKNVTLLLDAFRILAQRGAGLRLVLAGSEHPLVDIRRAIADRDLHEVVACTGYVTDVQAAALLRDARVFAWPSLYEGFGMPLIEAMVAGVPVVAVRNPPTPEVVGDAAVLTEPQDAESLADGIQQAATDEGLRSRLITEGQSRAATFTWAATARQTLDVYRTVAR